MDYIPTRTVSLQIAGLWALAVALPLLDLVGGSAEFFVAHRAGPLDIVLLTVLLILGPPVAAVTAVEVAGLAGPRVRSGAIVFVMGALAGIVAAQATVHAGVGRWVVALPLVGAAALAMAIAYRRSSGFRTFLALLSLAAVAAPVVFLAKPDVRTLLAGTSGSSSNDRAAAAPDASRATPVVMVVFDELPLVSLLDADRAIDRHLYPNIAALARDGVWYRNATTVADFTRYALPAMVSGAYPDRRALPSASHYPETLFTMLARTHRLEVSEPVTMLCPPTMCTADGRGRLARLSAMVRDLWFVFLHLVLPEDLAGGLPDLSATWANFDDDMPGASGGDDDSPSADPNADEVDAHWREGISAGRVAPVRQFIDGISKDDPQPTFYFLHALVSHQPHHLLPSGQENLTWHRVPGRRGWNRPHPWAVSQHYQRHLLQVGFVDRLVGELVARLKSTGLYESTLLVMTSDHGISYLPGSSQRDLAGPTAAEIMRVPLLIKFPRGLGEPGSVRDDNVESIDLLPTIADVMGIEVRARVDGSSLLDPARRQRHQKSMFTGDERHQRRFPASGPDLTRALSRKVSLLGDTSRNTHVAPHVPGFDAIVGQKVDALRVVAGAEPVEIAGRALFDRVEPSAPAVVFDVGGRFATPQPDAVVAVAVNGVVQAVTRTWEANPRGFMATPGFGVWRPGANSVEVFLVERDAAGLLLRSTSRAVVRPADLNLISVSAVDVWGVSHDGFHPRERAPDGTEFRWTRDWAEIADVTSTERPRQLEIAVLRVPTARKRLRIEANGCKVFDAEVQTGWTGSVPLDACDIPTVGLTLRFSTTAERPRGDARRLGVALSRVVLR